MVFSSTIFLFAFLPIVIIGYFALNILFRKLYLCNLWLLVMSLVFYSWNQPQFLWIMLVSIGANYLGGLWLATGNRKKKQAVLALNIFVNLGLLIYFKYFNFLLDTLQQITGKNFSIADIILPIGISFFTFQGMSYVIDVYMGRTSVQKDPFKLALYISLFPQLIAGPIVRYVDVAAEIDNRKISLEDAAEGISRFIVGLFKKVIISNAVAVTADAIWNGRIESYSAGIAWLGIIAYTFQIFFDFSGYSDMAIGLGRLFGFHFLENFNYPYISSSVTEFWRRWHISLSSWFRDYVYIPLGGNRRHQMWNISAVFLLTGIWHGANWTFILWGIWHGFFNILEKLQKKKNVQEKSWIQKRIGNIYVMLIVILGWVMFRADSISQAVLYFKAMFNQNNFMSEQPGFTLQYYLNGYQIFIMILALLLSTPVLKNMWSALKRNANENVMYIIEKTGLVLLFCLSIIRLVSSSYNPFIYFQF